MVRRLLFFYKVGNLLVHFQLCSEFQMYFWWSWMTKLIFIWVRGRNLNGSQLFLPSPSLRPQKLHCFIHVGASWADSLKCVKKSKSTLHDEMTPVTTLVWKKKKVISTFLLFVTGWLHDTHTSTYLSVWPLWTCKFDFYLLTSCQRVDVLSVLQTCYL